MENKIKEISELTQNQEKTEYNLNVLRYMDKDYRSMISFESYESCSSGTPMISFSMQNNKDIQKMAIEYWEKEKEKNEKVLNKMIK